MVAIDGSLRPGAILRYLRHMTSLVTASEDYRDVLSALVEELLPDLADEAELFVVGSDGRLYRRARAYLRRGRPSSELGVAGPLPRASLHPAQVAREEGAMAVEDGEGNRPRVVREDVLAGPGAPRNAGAVGLPLFREGEVAGALHLRASRDGGYATQDLERLAELGYGVSLALESARLRREARDARRAKADFLSVMSHELRTPLTAVVGYADLMEAGIPGPVNEGQQTHLRRIKESAWSLLELIDGILGYARYEGEDPELEVEAVDPSSLVEDAVAVYRSSLSEKGLELELEVSGDLPRLHTDREKAVRVLLHVLSNAQKFTDSGTVRVRAWDDPEWIHFVVEDTGPGIPGEDLSAVFEPFWQGQRADTRRHGGTGMGLSLARRLAELLSGELRVESEVGRGTVVRFSLPLQGPHPTIP